MSDDDQQRREHEMNMFAFHAAGSNSLSSLGPTGSIAFSKPSAGASSSDASPNQDALVAAAAALEHSSTPNNIDGSSSNRTFSPTADLRPNPILPPPSPKEMTPSDSIPLFTEEVLLPRPLFFGGALPNRVRGVLPPSIFDTQTVRTFQPVWGNNVRAAKLAAHRRMHQNQRPSMVARASTAPPRISPPPPPIEENMMDATDSEGSLMLMVDNEHLQADTQETPFLSEKDRFSQWALMGGASSTLDASSTNAFVDGGGTFLHNPNNNSSGSGMNVRSSFQTLPGADSDDDSVIEDEQRTKVGASDNLSKAIALLSEETHAAHAEEPSQVLLSQVAPDASRPLTNYELTEGCVPMFGADDAPLPQEADLGIHQTREEQLRTAELKRSHELIEKFVPPNVFGPIACPNPALGPGDCQSWNSRVRTRTRSPPRPPRASSSKRDGKRRVMKQRFGWWNKPWNEEESATDRDGSTQRDDSVTSTAGGPDLSKQHQNLQAPPVQHTASAIQVVTPLEPTPEQLREDNLPLSRMHAATTMAQSLPFLSDRPASFRYLQIDTQAVLFPPIGGGQGIEPLFCSVAIYNVETVASTIGSSNSNSSSSSKSPTPDLQRSGRVTEALQFDYVANIDMAERCRPSLWPYGGGEGGCGTRCGVFPIPSNLNVANLYAILIVRKVVGDESDFDPYLKPGKSWSDLAKLQANAEKAAERYGQLTLPFAFGVAPLLQVFGVENPVVATSRAVQIPLFHFTTGERQIIDHIMYMLHPKYVCRVRTH